MSESYNKIYNRLLRERLDNKDVIIRLVEGIEILKSKSEHPGINANQGSIFIDSPSPDMPVWEEADIIRMVNLGWVWDEEEYVWRFFT